MKPSELDTIVKERLEKIRESLVLKQAEYSDDDDVFSNFVTAGNVNFCSKQEALWGMATKHLVSIIDMVHNRKPATPSRVDEKIGDMINYLILLEAMYKGE